MAALVRAVLIRDNGAPRVCRTRTRVALEQDCREEKQRGTHRPPQHLSEWQAQEITAGRTAMAAHSRHPVPITAIPRPAAAKNPRLHRSSSRSAFTENVDILVSCSE